jgi:hypothetical protein
VALGATTEWTHYFKRKSTKGFISGGFVVEYVSKTHLTPSMPGINNNKFLASVNGESQTFLALDEAKAWVECRTAILLVALDG